MGIDFLGVSGGIVVCEVGVHIDFRIGAYVGCMSIVGAED